MQPEHKVSDFHLHHSKIVLECNTWLYIYSAALLMLLKLLLLWVLFGPGRLKKGPGTEKNKPRQGPRAVYRSLFSCSLASCNHLPIICLILSRLRAGCRGKVEEKWKSWSVSWSSVLLFLCRCAGPFATPPQPWLNHHYREHPPLV